MAVVDSARHRRHRNLACGADVAGGHGVHRPRPASFKAIYVGRWPSYCFDQHPAVCRVGSGVRRVLGLARPLDSSQSAGRRVDHVRSVAGRGVPGLSIGTSTRSITVAPPQGVLRRDSHGARARKLPYTKRYGSKSGVGDGLRIRQIGEPAQTYAGRRGLRSRPTRANSMRTSRSGP